mgnify:CR=1 FL=1
MTPHVCLTSRKKRKINFSHWKFKENNYRFVKNNSKINNSCLMTVTCYHFTGFNYSLTGLSIVVSEREGETDEEISFTYNPNQRIKNYNLDHFRYTQYVRLKTAASTTTGVVLDEVEVYAFSK